MSLTVVVDLDACQGYVCCLMQAPEVFDLDERGEKAVVRQPEPPPELREKVLAAARACPSHAIRVEST
jgi:ferredoxin